jgi:hypothetical protein
MRTTASVFLATILLGFIMLGADEVMAQSYMGNFCWSVTVTEYESGPITPVTFLSRFDVTHVGGASYALQGPAFPPEENPSILVGAAVVIGSDIYMTLTCTGTHPSKAWRNTGVLHGRINASSLNGTFYELYNSFNPSTRLFTPGYSAGTLTFVPCP